MSPVKVENLSIALAIIVCIGVAACVPINSTPVPTPQAQVALRTPVEAGEAATVAPAAGVSVLPTPRHDSQTSVEEALLKRRSVRSYSDAPLTLAEVSQLLWAAQGITDPARGFRTAPSAGALYPLEVYLVAGNVEGLTSGVYKYEPAAHGLRSVISGDQQTELYHAALGQSAVKDAPAIMVLSAVYERTTGKYGERGIRYVHMEAGHAAQNVLLEAVALGLGGVGMGAFDDDAVRTVTGMSPAEQPLYIITLGKP
jgi:SagB-type dehydrogenase family enzyme